MSLFSAWHSALGRSKSGARSLFRNLLSPFESRRRTRPPTAATTPRLRLEELETRNLLSADITSTVLSVSGKHPSSYGEALTLKATLTDISNGTVTPTGGTVTFNSSINGVQTTLGTANLTNGTATLSSPAVGAGTATLTATYNGTTNFTTSTSTGTTQTVNTANTSVTVAAIAGNPASPTYGETLKFIATVTDTSDPSVVITGGKGTVTFYAGALKLGSVPVWSGSATLPTGQVPAGSNNITAVYNGYNNPANSQANFATSAASPAISQTVGTATTSVTLVAATGNPNPSTYGQPLTFTATVTDTSDPSVVPQIGAVTLYNGSTKLAAFAISNGTASFTFPFTPYNYQALPVSGAAYSITASYTAKSNDNGVVNFANSTSSAVSQTVNTAASTSTLVTPAAPTAPGKLVTITATITNTASGSVVTPLGIVTFRDGQNGPVLGAKSVVNGVATLTTTRLSLGTHDIWAYYANSANNFKASSSNGSQVITAAPALVVSAGPSVSGNEGSAVKFAGTASGGTGALSYSWNFGDGTKASGSLTPSHVYANYGSYTATLTVTDSAGVTSQKSTTVTVADVAPTVTIGGPYNGSIGSAITFTGSATSPGVQETTAGFTYLWNFGDGTTSTVQNPTHTYASSSVYPVTLKVTESSGLNTTAATTATVSSGVLGENHNPFIITPWDKIPNFGQNPNIYSAQSGSWSDPSTWSLGRVPTVGDVVSIDPSTTVTYDVVSTAAINTVVIQAGGALNFRTDISTELTVVNLLVLEGGDLQIGSVASPVAANVTAQVVFANQALNTNLDPQQYGNGLIALGTVTMAGAAKNDTFVQLAIEPKAGDTTLTLATPVTGWQVGDAVTIPDTHQLNWTESGSNLGNYVSQKETVKLAGISADGLVLTLASPLQYAHLGARDANGVLDFLPNVANLSSNVKIHSESAIGVRGYVMFTDRANVDIRNAGFYGLGRTTNDLYDDTTFDAKGNVTHVGTNEQDRTPVSFHHLMGPTGTPADGYQYTFIGNAVFCPLEPMNFRWGITLDDSHYGLIQDNVVDNWAGAGIMTEEGNESYNVISHNFIIDVDGIGGRSDTDYYAGGTATGAYGRDGAGIWLSGPNNFVDNNVATDIYAQTTSYGYNLSFYRLANIRVPLFQGADTSVAGQYEVENGSALPLLDFSGNTAYGAIFGGVTVWWLGADDSGPTTSAPSVIKNFTVWNARTYGYYGYATNNITLDGFTQRGDVTLLKTGNGTTAGLFFSDYLTMNMTVTNADIQGVQMGILAPEQTGATAFTVQNSYLRDQVDVAVQTMWRVSYRSDGMLPKLVVLNNVQFAAVPGLALRAIDMQYNGTLGGSNLIQLDQVFVNNYNGVAGDNFQVFYTQQAANFVMPQSVLNADGSPNILGAPISGLTNQEAWTTYGIAIGGAVAPASAKVRIGINGLIEPL